MQDKWTANQLKAQEWLAMPRYERIPPTQELFADSIGINSCTITRWKKLDGFTDAVNALARTSVGESLPQVYGALVREAEKGSIQHIRTVLELTGELKQMGTEGNEIIFRVVRD
jgi:hypothetical protein